MKRLFTNKTSSARLGSHTHSNRAISLLLSFALLLTMMPQTLLPVRSVESEEQTETVTETEYQTDSVLNYNGLIGATAQFNIEAYINFAVDDDPKTFNDAYGSDGEWATHEKYLNYYDGGDNPEEAVYDFDAELTLVIKDYFVNADTLGIWFKVEAAEGYTLPTMLAENPWVFQNWADVYAEEGWEEYAADCLVITNGDYDPTTGIVVKGELPAGAEISVEIPTVDGETLPNVFDIKVKYTNEDGELVEWQPIDEGKTVQISIPVEGVEDVYVCHYLDYEKAFDNPGVEYISIEGANEIELEMVSAAIAASDRDGYVPREKFGPIEVVDGTASLGVNSFSVFYYEVGTGYEQGDGTESNPVNLNIGGSGTLVDPNDDGKYYFANIGSTLYFHTSRSATVSCEYQNNQLELVLTNPSEGWWDTSNKVYTVTITDKADFYTPYTVSTNYATITIVVIPLVILKFETHLTNGSYFVELPTPNPMDEVFLGNTNTQPADDTELKTMLDAGQYPAMIKTINNPKFMVGDTPVEGYTFNGWYLKHDPTKVFTPKDGVTTIYLSNTDLQVELEKGVGSYEITLVADVSADPHKVTYDYNDGTTANKTIEYLFEETLTIEDPTRVGYNFLYWQLDTENIDLVESWTAEFTDSDYQVPGGSTVTNMYGDVTLTAVWEAAGNTAYSVRHMYESLTNPGTYEFTGEVTTQYGTTGEMTNAALAKKPVAGFYVDEADANSYLNVEITGDGQAVAEVRYKRAEITITFKDPLVIDGGTGDLGASTGLYGATITGIPTPTKDNYVFMGWYTADYPDQLYTPTTYPATNLTLYAKWNLDKVAIDLMDGETLLGRINEEATTQIDMPVFSKAGYKLEGWYKDKNLTELVAFPYTLNEERDDNTSWYAKWTEINYSVIFDTDDGTLDGEINPTKYYTINTMPTSILIPTKTGYSFGGWYATEDCTGTAYTTTTLAAELQADDDNTITVYAKWTIISYTITFVNDDGTLLQQLSVPYGDMPVYTGATPTKDSDAQFTYTFDGWDSEIVAVTGNKTYKATYSTVTNTYTVTWVNEDGTVLETDYNVPYGTVPTYNGDTPTKEATDQYTYTFKEWSPTVQAVTGTIEYTATFTPTEQEYTITWVDGNGNELYSEKVAYGETPVYNGKTPTKNATAQYTYTFSGWYPEIEPVKGAVTYTAQFTSTVRQYTITWKNYDGTVLHTASVSYGSVPSYGGVTPTKAATAQYTYTFAGWDTEVVAVTGVATYTATYSATVNKYTITFVNEDGTVLQSSEWEYGSTPVYSGATPTKAASAQYTYTFSGWTPAITLVTGTATYTATYTEIASECTVTFDAGGGTEIDPVTQAYNSSFTAPSTTKKGYTFLGWAENKNGVVVYAAGATITITGDMTLYAVWEAVQYTITYNLDGGSVKTANPTGYTIESGDITLVNPTKKGYTFAGWTGTGLSEPTVNVTIPSGSTGDRTYTATWTVSLRIGINVAYYTVGNTYYHDLPDTATVQHYFPTMRAYYDEEEREWKFTNTKAGYKNDIGIDYTLEIEKLLESCPDEISGAYGVVDHTGEKVKEYFQFNYYDELLAAWLGADATGTEIDWGELSVKDCSIIPYVVKLQDDGIWYVDMLVVVNKTSLTISVYGDTVDSADAFLYQIASSGMTTLTVVVRKDTPVTIDGLLLGKQYTITQVAAWSWKYGASPGWAYTMGSDSGSGTGNEVTITLKEAAEITFTNALEKDGWLDGEASSNP